MNPATGLAERAIGDEKHTEERRLAELHHRPDFEPGWRMTPTALLENSAFGSIRHRLVLSRTGEPLYDFPHILEPGGAAVLPLTKDGQAGLIRVERPALLKCELLGSYPDFVVPGDFGRIVWEAPRGGRDGNEDPRETARRETREETGLRLGELTHVGAASTNSALLATNVDLFLAFVDDAQANPPTRIAEGIREFRFFNLREIRRLMEAGEFICSISQALVLKAVLREYLY